MIGFRGGRALLLPFGPLEGIGLGCKAELLGTDPVIYPSDRWLGRVVNAMGEAIDAKGALLHQRQAGLVLLSQVRMLGLPEEGMPRFEVVPLDDPLSDPTRLAAGIDRALNPYLPALGGGSRGGS